MDVHTKFLNTVESKSRVISNILTRRKGLSVSQQHLDIVGVLKRVKVESKFSEKLLTHNCTSAPSIERQVLAMYGVKAELAEGNVS